MTRPNIILFMSDNQPADLLGCYGNDEVQTPCLDQLAARGVRFQNAYCVNAMCSPCRASVLTGLMPSQHGIHNWLDDRLIDHWPKNWSAIGAYNNIPSIIKQAGYTTALIGKFHLGVPFVPQLAFDHWVTFPHGHTTSFYDNDVIDQEERYRFAGHTVDFFTDKTIEFLEHQAGEDDPFFAFVPYNGPYGHWPAIKGRPDIEFADLYDTADMHSIPREGLASEVLERFGLRVAEGGVREQFKGPLLLPNNVESLRNYFAQVSLIDSGVGRILNTLERLGMDENTIVIYTSDHGFSLGHNGIWGHGAAAFPASAHRPSYHIPMIMAGSGIVEGDVCDGLSSQIDLFPTLASLVGAPEASPSLPSSARDLGPALRGEALGGAKAVFFEQEETRAVRTKDWLYAMRFQGAPSYPMKDELYRLTDDPNEKQNLIDQPEFSGVISDLQGQVTSFFDSYSVPEYDLWRRGSAKSNVTYQKLWQDAWGDDWRPEFSN
ncbi:sulfatase-like hydrolase/transferase [Tropicibacter sp. R16_0]|uniref:sulfatase family protein n=1 Tax=Tropicibacter sp. R16_0 TaxID=2821102 RepID=UPI001ADCAA96|nr:sulfatase-like hydrolase/transferase [Tropicibacter sp. R16_0]MBO9452996.1 sulfatase-like hydrolase/transferase [Tropicibacter sp. R16_0]